MMMNTTYTATQVLIKASGLVQKKNKPIHKYNTHERRMTVYLTLISTNSDVCTLLHYKYDHSPMLICFIQKLASKWTSSLLDMCKEQTPCPNSKIVKNLCNFLCCDPQHTPAIVPKLDEASRPGEVWEWNNGIITLVKQQQKVSCPLLSLPYWFKSDSGSCIALTV